MRSPTVMLLSVMLLSFCLLAGAPAAYADNEPLDCSRKSLGDAVRDVYEKDRPIRFTGVCAGPIVIRTDGISLAPISR